MKNIKQWKPTKFIFKGDVLTANPKYVYRSSFIMANLLAKALQKIVDKYATGDLLDLGCGTVPLYEIYKNKTKSITCADWQNSVHENIHLDVDQDLTKPLKFDDNKFDTVIASDVLEHLPYPLDLMKEVNRVIKKDGHFILSTPFSYWQHEEPFDFNRYTEFMYSKLAEDSGFEVVSVDKLGNQLESILDIWGKMLCRIENKVIRFVFSAGFYCALKLYKVNLLNIKIKDNKQPLAYVVVLKKVK